MSVKMDLNALVLFYEVANSQSLTRASEKLRTPKSTISRKIAILEHQIGSILLKRGHRKLVLTDIGRVLYDHCQKIISEIEDAGFQASEMQSELRGVLRVSLPVDFGVSWLGKLIAEFAIAYPDIQLEVEINNHWVNVAEAPYDVSIQIGNLRNTHLPVKVFTSLRRGVYAAPDYLARCGAPKTLEDLQRHDCIMTEHQRDEGVWKFLGDKDNRVVEIEPRIIVNNIGIAREIIASGLGIGIMPNVMCRNDVAAQRLVRLFPDWRSPPLQAAAFYAGRRRIPRKTKAFLDFLSDRLLTDE
ncbi:LysR family transcriptional regulator [Azospirillum sp.]|uniref:LysR family transcriptional regulator n=1 Tax=Azospirillum sp. TaxID=34012 RepID=UPI002D728863|nr:LysR family transcriptional regulator [Azospirillum sp.]HYD69003.1 LysR family transcriptional regulator [Azospirillum sp.]